MKKGVLFSLVALVIMMSSFLGACTAAPTEVIELSYSNFFPPTHLHSILAEEWIKEIETRTNGAVKITYYPGGTLTPAPKTYDGVAEGISDIGMSLMLFVVTFIVGMVLGYLIYKTKSIWGAIIIHIGLDLFYGLTFGFTPVD